jgi:hypothetical protein
MNHNKLAQIKEFCKKVGIFNHKSCNFGAYGELLRQQIYKEWLRAHQLKFENTLLITSVNILSNEEQGQVKKKRSSHPFDINYFVESSEKLINNFPISFLNSYESNDSKMIIQKKQSHHLFNLPTLYLNAFHFCDDNHNKVNSYETVTDSLSFWQRERKNWWCKILNYPEFITYDSADINNKHQSSLNYKPTDTNEEEEIYCLEKIFHYAVLSGDSLLDIPELNFLIQNLKKSSKIFQTKMKQVVLTQTNTNAILESILLDSLSITKNDRFIFNLDYRIAPFKACVLYQAESDDQNLNSNNNKSITVIANDLRKGLSLNNVNVLCCPVNSSTHLKEKYQDMDELGIPFTIYLSQVFLKNGVCLIRNRDTGLEEEIHFSDVVEKFSFLSKAFNN